MNAPLRVLTMGFNGAFNEALARREGLQVTSLSQETKARCSDLLRVMPYEMKSKLSMRAIARVSKTIREVQPDVVLTYGSRPLAHTVLSTSGMKSSQHIYSFRSATTPPSKLHAEEWITYLSPRVTAHACESQAALEGLVAAGIPRERCFLAYNCLGETPKPASRSDLDRFGIPRDAFVVAMAANLRPSAGADVLLRAAAECADLKDTYWFLMGQNRDSRLKRLAKDPGIRDRVVMPGFVPGATSIAATADLYIAPSRNEALSTSLLEAMCLGACPVVSNAGAMKEAVRDSQDGVVFSHENPSDLAAAIRNLYTHRELVACFSHAASKRYSTTFTANAMAQRIGLRLGRHRIEKRPNGSLVA